MKEIPILFSTPMVQAILSLLKGMTRRTRGLEKINQDPDSWIVSGTYHILTTNYFEAVFEHKTTKELIGAKCYYGLPGDLLWVREKFAKTIGVFEPEITYSYFADSFHWSFFPNDEMKGETSCQWHDEDLAKEVAWKPSIHMLKDTARIWLQVEEIRVERLQDISEEDAIAEGCYSRNWFEGLWGKLNGDASWEINPWVWVVKYKILSTTGKPKTDTG